MGISVRKSIFKILRGRVRRWASYRRIIYILAQKSTENGIYGVKNAWVGTKSYNNASKSKYSAYQVHMHIYFECTMPTHSVAPTQIVNRLLRKFNLPIKTTMLRNLRSFECATSTHLLVPSWKISGKNLNPRKCNLLLFSKNRQKFFCSNLSNDYSHLVKQ